MTKGEVAQERKNQVVLATIKCITEYGYHNFSMQDVARAAGVSKGVIHYYFINKEELMMAVLAKVVGDIEERLIGEIEVASGPKEKLLIFIDICLGVVYSTKEYYHVNMDFWTQVNQKTQVKDVIAAHYKRFRLACSEVLQMGIAKGVFRKVNPNSYSAYILGLIDGISLQLLFDNQAFERQQLTSELKELLLRGLEPENQ